MQLFLDMERVQDAKIMSTIRVPEVVKHDVKTRMDFLELWFEAYT